MKFRSLDANGDWKFGRGLNDYLTDNDAILKNIETRLKSWLDDCFFALDEGIDYSNFLGQTGREEELKLQLRTRILESYGVIKLISFDFSTQDRQLTANFTINTLYSENVTNNIIIGI